MLRADAVMSTNGAPKVTVLVKALNEERTIAVCLEAAVAEAAALDGEVILVDSLSTDDTVTIAKTFAVRIVQFVDRHDRGCAAAVQLGYQYASGEYIYVLDGDMVLERGFLAIALRILESAPDVAGVGGLLREQQVSTTYDLQRAHTTAAVRELHDVPELGGGGMYRRAAIEQVGYLAHRGLAAFEEAELGARLRTAGWRLLKVPQISATHRGHAETDLAMFRRLWRNRRAHAHGQLLRSAIGNKWWWRVCLKQRHIFATLGIHALAVAAALASATIGVGAVGVFLIAELLLWLAVFALQSFSKRDARWAAFSVLSWHYFTIAALIGLFQRVADPRAPIRGRLVHCMARRAIGPASGKDADAASDARKRQRFADWGVGTEEMR